MMRDLLNIPTRSNTPREPLHGVRPDGRRDCDGCSLEYPAHESLSVPSPSKRGNVLIVGPACGCALFAAHRILVQQITFSNLDAKTVERALEVLGIRAAQAHTKALDGDENVPGRPGMPAGPRL